ncbi:MAG: hypothetical protein ABI910_03865 [Gemmatimonadota bacterium]
MPFSLDYRFILADAVSGGVAPDGFAGAQTTFAAAHAAVSARHASDELGFFDRPRNRSLAGQVLENASVRGRYRDVVLLGIGGWRSVPSSCATHCARRNGTRFPPRSATGCRACVCSTLSTR